MQVHIHILNSEFVVLHVIFSKFLPQLYVHAHNTKGSKSTGTIKS